MFRGVFASVGLMVAAVAEYPLPSGLKLEWLGSDSPKCLDGTPTGYYIRRSKDSTSTDWVVFLQGGSMCFNEDDCEQRKSTWLGSSDYWAAELDKGSGAGLQLMSPNATINPDFHAFNHLYVPYCSGDVFVGKQGTPVNPFGEDHTDATFYFQGFDLFTNVTEKLLMDATRVLLTGTSAGGIGDFFVADYLSATIPNAVVKASPEAGWFGFGPFDDYEHFSKGEDDPDPYHINGQHGWLGGITMYVGPAIADCYGDTTQDYHLCGFAPFMYRFIKTPFFIAENVADSFQVTHTAGMGDYEPVEQIQKDYVVHFGTQMQDSLKLLVVEGPKSATDGIFAPSCYAHFLDWDVQINGVTWATALGNWFFEREGETQLVDTDVSFEKFMSCASAPPGQGGAPTPADAPAPTPASGTGEADYRQDPVALTVLIIVGSVLTITVVLYGAFKPQMCPAKGESRDRTAPLSHATSSQYARMEA